MVEPQRPDPVKVGDEYNAVLRAPENKEERYAKSVAKLERDRLGNRVDLTGDTRERIAAAIHNSRPSPIECWPSRSYDRWVWNTQKNMYLEWADRLLSCCDSLGLSVTDLQREL